MKYIVNQYGQLKTQAHKRNKIQIINKFGKNFDFSVREISRLLAYSTDSNPANLDALTVETIVADGDKQLTHIEGLAGSAQKLRDELFLELSKNGDVIGAS